MIRPLQFLDTATFTAYFLLKHKAKMDNGILPLRDLQDDDEAPSDMPVLAEWKSAKALLTKLRNGAAAYFEDKVPELGRSWIETLPPESGTPWTRETGDYADEHIRLRICLIPAPDAFTFSGQASAILGVGVVNMVDHKQLCSEVNLGGYARTHLVVDVRKPDEEA